jgi:hypothetical protein
MHNLQLPVTKYSIDVEKHVMLDGGAQPLNER